MKVTEATFGSVTFSDSSRNFRAQKAAGLHFQPPTQVCNFVPNGHSLPRSQSQPQCFKATAPAWFFALCDIAIEFKVPSEQLLTKVKIYLLESKVG